MISTVSQSRLSDALRQKLAEKAWSQKRLAEVLDKDDSTVSLWVSGRQTPRIDDIDSISKLAKFLATSPDHVRTLIAAQKEPDASQPSLQQRITNLDSFTVLLKNNAFLRGLVELHLSRATLAGVRDRFFEEGYDVEESVLQRFWNTKPEAAPPSRGAVRVRGAVRTAAAPSAFADSAMAREAVRQSCRALNTLFAAHDNALGRPAAAECIQSVCEPLLRADASKAADIVVGHCLALHLLRQHDDELRRDWPLSAEFVLNSIWGLRTGIDNFDFMLDGGWLPPADRGFTVLVKGKAGRGKTMFALQTAASMASQGHTAVYIAAEETAVQLLGRLSYAGFATAAKGDKWQTMCTPSGARFECFTSNDIEADDATLLSARQEETQRGILFIVEAPQRRAFFRPNGRLLLHLEAIRNSVAARGQYTLIVFDSLDALDPQTERRAFERLAAFARRDRTLALFVSEIHDARPQPSLRDHVVDVAIRLDVRERLNGFTERVIEIEKCRTQSHIRGAHMFAIHGGRGLSVYPSVQSQLSVWRRRIRRPEPAATESWKVDDLDFDAILHQDLSRGATILLNGPPHTHRFLLGLSFLAAGLRERPASHAILVSLREDPAAILRIVAHHPQLAGLLDPDRPGALNPRLRVLHFPPDYFSAERFLDWLRRVFREYRERRTEVGRILFSSLSQLLHNSPMFGVEPLFVDGLLELFKRKEVTSLFLDSQNQRDIANAFDLILFSGCEPGGRVTLQIAHSGPCNAEAGVFAVKRELRENGAWLRLEAPKPS
jgi:KaiC/GvpD/RAD55 family RecA-like ATPase/transcriptional regulator with XRE-family HTH domain